MRQQTAAGSNGEAWAWLGAGHGAKRRLWKGLMMHQLQIYGVTGQIFYILIPFKSRFDVLLCFGGAHFEDLDFKVWKTNLFTLRSTFER